MLLTEDEQRTLSNIQRNSDIVREDGKKGAIALLINGFGPETQPD